MGRELEVGIRQVAIIGQWEERIYCCEKVVVGRGVKKSYSNVSLK